MGSSMNTSLYRTFFLLLLILIATVFLPASSSFAQRDISREILVYFSSGVHRNSHGQSEAMVVSHGVRGILNRFNIQSHSVKAAFPDFDESDTLKITGVGRVIKRANMAKIFRLTLPNGVIRDHVIEALSHNPHVIYAEQNAMVKFDMIPNDAYFDDQWALHNTGQINGTIDADIDAPEAWDITTGGSSSIIGIIDSGIDATHPDLSGKVSGDVGWSLEHGTHVAGIAGALTNNIIGVAGVDQKAELHSQRLLSSIEDMYQAVVDAVDYDSNVHVLNNSWHIVDENDSPIYSRTVHFAFKYAYEMNRTAVAAMGNDYNSGNPTSYPAAFGHEVIAVGATDHKDVKAYFSSAGDHISVVAPGVFIISTTIDGAHYPNDPNYEPKSGTSMAAPFVSGIASLLKGYRSDLYNDDIKRIIELSTDKPEDMGGQDFTNDYGYGRVNAHKALQALQPPHALRHETATGYDSSTDAGYYRMLIIGAEGLADNLYIVKRYEVQKQVSYSRTINPYVWGRGVDTDGWAQDKRGFKRSPVSSTACNGLVRSRSRQCDRNRGNAQNLCL